MTLEEILDAGKQGEISIFEAYDLIGKRVEENLSKIKTIDDSKTITPENDSLIDLKEYIEKSVFNTYAENNLEQKNAAMFLTAVYKNIFLLEKARTENQNEKTINHHKEITKKTIKSCIDFLKQLEKNI